MRNGVLLYYLSTFLIEILNSSLGYQEKIPESRGEGPKNGLRRYTVFVVSKVSLGTGVQDPISNRK
jgi:hypothetical protein